MVYDWVADEKHQNNDFHFTKSNFLYFWTCRFVKFESKCSFKLCKLQLPKEISNDICKVIFNVCLWTCCIKSLDYHYMLKNWFKIHHTHIHLYTHIINLMTYLDRSTASFLLFFLGKGWSGQNCFCQTKCGRLQVI